MSDTVMRELMEWYLTHLATQLKELDGLIANIETDDKTVLVSIRELAHKLVGSAESYGYSEVTKPAIEVEEASDDQILDKSTELSKIIKILLKKCANENTYH
ncbi:MAG: Hpt domain-containing protein [Candidatus Lindowbacteria bacterium]|nr:Hpt domain-containing protein [Candidatus Lindowbacteria bacterium]